MMKTAPRKERGRGTVHLKSNNNNMGGKITPKEVKTSRCPCRKPKPSHLYTTLTIERITLEYLTAAWKGSGELSD